MAESVQWLAVAWHTGHCNTCKTSGFHIA